MRVVPLSKSFAQRIVAPPVNAPELPDSTPSPAPVDGPQPATHGSADRVEPASAAGADPASAEAPRSAGEPGADGPRKRRRRRRRKHKGADGAAAAGDVAEGGAAEVGDAEAGDAEGGDTTAGAAAGGGEPRGADAPKGDRQRGPRPDGKAERRDRGKRGRDGKPGREDRSGRDRKHGRDGHGRDGHGRPRRDSQHHAIEAIHALAEMAQSLLRIEGVEPMAMPRYLDLNLRIPMDGGNDVRHAAGTAVEQILKRVREVREHEKALRPGAVYCYFAGSSSAEGTRPIEPRHVFEGYSSTGKPIFTDFVTMAIERKDPAIDRLLAGEELVLTRVSMGRVLRTQQLAEFGGESPIYRILGQVDAGLFKVLSGPGKCAFSFQLLRGSTLEGRVRLRMHAVGAMDLMDLADPAVLQILSRFQRRLDTEALRLEGQQAQGGEVDEESFVRPLLEDFARQLQNRSRNTGRRTQHGLERSETGQRPTSRAYPDAGEASDSDILWDIDQGTVVVLGPKGRVHVFTPDAKHVTSVVMQGDAIGRRRNMGRWRAAEPEERGEFRIQVRRRVAAGDDATVGDEPIAPTS
jgi:hypothetical protein